MTQKTIQIHTNVNGGKEYKNLKLKQDLELDEYTVIQKGDHAEGIKKEPQ